MKSMAKLILLAFSVSVASGQSLTITTEKLPNGEAGVSYEAFMSAAGGVPPYTWTYMGGLFPPFMGFSQEGRIFGTPKEGGTLTFPVQVRDSVGGEATKTVELTVLPAPLRIVNERLGITMQGEFFTTVVHTEGGTPPKTFTLLDGPDGMDITTVTQGLHFPEYVGVFSGRTLEAGTHLVTIQVTDSSSPVQTVNRMLEFVVEPAPLVSLSMEPVERAYFGKSYSTGIQIVGGAAPFGVEATGAPLWLSVNVPEPTLRGIQLAGVPMEMGTFEFLIEVQDGLGVKASRPVLLDVVEAVEITSTELPDAYVGKTYSFPLVATGGVLPHTWSAITQPPPGLSLDSAGVLSGTTSVGGGTIAKFWVEVRDSADPPVISSELVGVVLRDSPMRILTRGVPGARLGSEYQTRLTATGGVNAFDWYLVSGTLPAGLELQTNGTIMGTPNETGRFRFQVRAEDRSPIPASDTRLLEILVGSSLGRNNTIATATPISNGRHQASISPLGAIPDVVEPDVDVYAVTAVKGTTLRVETFGERRFPQSPIDSVIEIVDANGIRLTNCINETTGSATLSCMNDDHQGVLDSRLRLQLAGSGTQTVFIRVLDWRGDARPDLQYEIEIEGAATASTTPLIRSKTPRINTRTP